MRSRPLNHFEDFCSWEVFEKCIAFRVISVRTIIAIAFAWTVKKKERIERLLSVWDVL